MCAGINLLPEQKELCKKNKHLFYIIVLLNSAVLLSVLLIWCLALWQTLSTINKKNSSIKNRLHELAQKTPNPKHKQSNDSKNSFINHKNIIANNQNRFISIINNINKNIETSMQLTQLNIDTNQGKLFGTTEEIVDITNILQDFTQSQHYINPMVEKIVRQNYRYSFMLSWRFKH